MNFDLFALIKPAAMGILRTFAAGWAAYLANRGFMSADMVQQFTGAIMFLGAIGFSVADKMAVALIKAEFENMMKPNGPPSTIT